ncbi:MAG: polyprenyl synthetase family protein [Planctomycetes bacterium]|nr:polyprenyl synthetase family protein [Planctomycetota bacterium]
MGAPQDESLEAWLEAARRWSEAALERHAPAPDTWPAPLAEAARYALFAGGKRLRPALVRLFCELEGGAPEAAERPAAAVEMLHTYSLVHDDLPCMDDDDLRRGRPTCHKVYGEAVGVLVGDALLTEAFAVLSGVGAAGGAMCALLARAAGGAGMVGGQVLDMTLAGSAADAAGVRAVHRLKTAALIAVACELGALAAGASAERRALARAYGEALGLGFQAVDDVLDETGDAATLGKTPGKDRELDRATMVAVLGLQGARGEAEARAGEALEAAARLGHGPASLPAALVRALVHRSH